MNSIMPTKLQRLIPIRIFEQAVEQIRDLISSGILTAGEKLPTEQELCKQLGVSRSSVREALRVLEAEDLVEIRRSSGAYISSPRAISTRGGELVRWLAQRKETIDQVLQVRESIETLTTSLAASVASPEALAEIRGIVEVQASLSKQAPGREDAEIDTLAHYDALFHLAISSASGNDIAHEIITHIIPAFNESNKAVLYLGRRVDSMKEEHYQILAALEVRNPIAAAEAMHNHILNVRKEILEIQSEKSAGIPLE